MDGIEDRQGAQLLALARVALEEALRGDPTYEAAWHRDGWLQGKGATFVTLMENGQLRGCIGNVEPLAPLIDIHRQNAVGAATRDPRFPAVKAAELESIEIEVTLLSVPEPMTFFTVEEALGQLRPGIDGVVLEWRDHRATYLPQVWQSLPEPERFLESLREKAGLAADFWHEDLLLARYRAAHWDETALAPLIDEWKG